MRIARLTIAALAIVVAAWFALGIRQSQETDQATQIIAQPRSQGRAAELQHAAALLDSAAFLNPDRTVGILKGRLAIVQNQPRRGERVLEGVTRSEPLNLEAWIWLAGAALVDPPEAKVALAHIHTLDPRAR